MSQSGFQLSGVYASYLTSADLTGVIGWMETVTWTIHSAIQYTVYSTNNHIRLSCTKTTENPDMKHETFVPYPSFAYQHTQGSTPRER